MNKQTRNPYVLFPILLPKIIENKNHYLVHHKNCKTIFLLALYNYYKYVPPDYLIKENIEKVRSNINDEILDTSIPKTN